MSDWQDNNAQSPSGQNLVAVIVLSAVLIMGLIIVVGIGIIIGTSFIASRDTDRPQAINIPKDLGPAIGPLEMEGPKIGEPAPEIEGEDIDGNPMKLSDFRGKVVLIDFWGEWCPHCVNLIPHARELAEKMKDKPFVLLGVNSDRNRERVKQFVKERDVTWRSWWNGGSPAGPISAKYGVQGWPTLYLIDDKGIVRARWVGAPSPQELDKTVEEWVAKVGT
ncbi:MAG: TlpA family protein disulfide reductase [Gemmatales bacterium]|nr:TlpA family protein disulfide reductase [Gemmatales bacterium]MDW8386109.1 TlpA disulfide reductase family protein [Gemmatales bacterium]